MNELWYQNTTIYCVDIERFQDSNGDGVGDFAGLASRIDYLAALGVDCIWLLPHYQTPNRDNGYDISDYYTVDPRLGDIGDFVDFMRQAKNRGIRVLLDLVVSHTASDHPWFQAARRDPQSPFRDFYIWSDEPTDDAPPRIVFNASDNKPWDYEEQAGQYYLHRFYRHEPDLNTANPALQREICKIMDVWLQLGAHGFRIDAAPYVGQKAASAFGGDPHGLLKDLREFLVARSGDSALMAEAAVDPKQLDAYFGGGDEMQLLLNFSLANYIFLALARESSEPLRHILKLLPRPPRAGQWANFLRNQDELSLEQLALSEREEVYAAFAPKENMRVYNRGIRRRLAPMLGGDQARIRMTYSLLFSLPGTPVILYGDEIGMGDDLAQNERNAVRTPMQWSNDPNAGFSSASSDHLVLPIIGRGAFSYKKINAGDQRVNPDSLLNWFRRLIALRKEVDEIAHWAWELVDTGEDRALVMRYNLGDRCLLTAHNLCSTPVKMETSAIPSDRPGIELFADRQYERVDPQHPIVELRPHGYRWIRFIRSE